MYLRGEVLSHNTISTSPHLLRCMYQARKVSGHVLCVSGIEFPSFYDLDNIITKWRDTGTSNDLQGIVQKNKD
jgi:hypothetical protein